MRDRRHTGYRVRLTQSEKAQLETLADQAGVTVADALRRGALIYLEARCRILYPASGESRIRASRSARA